MELSIKPCHRNAYPLGGVLIRGEGPATWIAEIEAMGLSLSAVDVYPLPGRSANSLWGCLLVAPSVMGLGDIGRNSYLQLVADILFIPEGAVLFPAVMPSELRTLLPSGRYVLHPELQLVELGDPVNWTELITLPEALTWKVREPAAPHSVPARIRSFQVKPVAADDALRQLEEQHFPRREKLEGRPLNPLEKIRLFFYRQLFRKKGEGSSAPVEKKPLLTRLEKLAAWLAPKGKQWTNEVQLDYEQLERRNQKHLDRLLDLLKSNPEEALKYAVPLDEGTGRGGSAAAFELQKRWFDFSLFGNTGRGSGSGSFVNDHAYLRLQEQYNQTAQELLRRQEYRKAAFVYLKLLKSARQAAQALEEGRHYGEAASVCLKYLQNKELAARCYEKGAMTGEAIALYKELGQDEKVGDLYMALHKTEEAFVHYEKVAEGYKASFQYLKASLLYQHKMGREAAARELLLLGWRSGRDAVSCLGAYFSNISDEKTLDRELKAVYGREVGEGSRENFLQVIKQVHRKHPAVRTTIEEMAYELVVAELPANPSVVAELNAFHKEDKQLLKDTFRFKIGGRKKL